MNILSDSRCPCGGIILDDTENACLTIKQLKAERDDAYELLGHAAKLMFPGERDTTEALLKLFQDLHAENKLLIEQLHAKEDIIRIMKANLMPG